MIWDEIVKQPLFGVAATLVAYAFSQLLHEKWKRVHPLFVTSLALIALLLVTGIPYDDYRKGGDLIVFFLGPATVALGVPLYKQALKLRRCLIAIVTGVTIGSLSGMASAAALVVLLHGTRVLMLTMLPKSVTAPISVEIVRQLGGMPELGAVLTVLTGLLGSLLGPEFLRAVGVRRDVAIGAAVGTASHGIGTARLLRESELQGSVSGLAMGLAGVVTSVLAIPLYGWLA